MSTAQAVIHLRHLCGVEISGRPDTWGAMSTAEGVLYLRHLRHLCGDQQKACYAAARRAWLKLYSTFGTSVRGHRLAEGLLRGIMSTAQPGAMKYCDL